MSRIITLESRSFFVSAKELQSLKSSILAFKHVYSSKDSILLPFDYLRLKFAFNKAIAA